MKPINCVVCGQFVGYQDVDAYAEYIPETHLSNEEIDWICGKCAKKESNHNGRSIPNF